MEVVGGEGGERRRCTNKEKGKEKEKKTSRKGHGS
jgi:hypothetical protein